MKQGSLFSFHFVSLKLCLNLKLYLVLVGSQQIYQIINKKKWNRMEMHEMIGEKREIKNNKSIGKSDKLLKQNVPRGNVAPSYNSVHSHRASRYESQVF